MQFLSSVATAAVVLFVISAGLARGDDLKVNTPVVTAALEGSWELQAQEAGGFKETLDLGPGLTGQWQQSKPTLPVTIAWFVEGGELRILHYHDPDGAFNYRVKTIMVGYKLSGDKLTLTFDGKPTTWSRIKAAVPAKP